MTDGRRDGSPRASLNGQIGHVLLLVVVLAHVLSRVRHRGVGEHMVLRRLVLLLVVSHVGRPVMVMVTVVVRVYGDGHVTAVVHGRTVAVAVVAARRRLLAGRVRSARARLTVFHQNGYGHSSRRTLRLRTNTKSIISRLSGRLFILYRCNTICTARNSGQVNDPQE